MKQLKMFLPALTLIGFVASGCGNQPAKPAENSTALRSDVSDIRPVEASQAAYQPVQQVTYDPAPVAAPTVAPSVSAAPVSSRAAFATSGNTHIVKRGETLYSIARQSYGDGKQWQKIAMANPGVTPGSLKVGQSLIVP